MAYNLRSKNKTRNCYLKKKLLVVLERNKILDNVNNCNSFYVQDGKIVSKKSQTERSDKKFKLFKYCFIFCCILSVWIAIYKYEKGRVSIYAVKNETTINQVNSAILEEILNLQNQSEYCVDESEETTKKFVVDYLQKKSIKIKKTIQENFKSARDFINNQCEALHTQFADNLSNFDDEVCPSHIGTDYALQSAGAKIVSSFNTQPYGAIALKFWKFDFGVLPNFFSKTYINIRGPTFILEPTHKSGNCWTFKGSHGRVQIQLAKKTFINAITVDYPRKSDNIFTISAAPKTFSVIGIENIGSSNLQKTYLGSFEYAKEGPSVQVFTIKPKLNATFNGIEISFESNQGNPAFTCVCKVGVYG